MKKDYKGYDHMMRNVNTEDNGAQKMHADMVLYLKSEELKMKTRMMNDGITLANETLDDLVIIS